MKTICIYDNHLNPNVFIRNIIGEKKFGEVILKRKSIKSKFLNFINNEKTIDEVLILDYDWQITALLNKLLSYGADIHIIHIFSHMVIKEEKEVHILLKKAPYILENYLWITEKRNPVLFMMHSLLEYCEFLEKANSELNNINVFFQYKQIFQEVTTDTFWDLSIHSNFLQYISGGFDTRFFNSVKGDEFTVVKFSRDKKKIEAEYKYYQLLPDYMKMWFVMPYNYQEVDNGASYEMERYHMTDLAIRWVHGAIDIDEMDKLLNKVFHFINTRKSRIITKEEYKRIEQKLYIDKLRERVKKLIQHEKYDVIQNYISAGTKYKDLDEIVAKYERLYHDVSDSLDKEYVSVIGHGDLCFSNMLFNKEADLLKLIDPKGAIEEYQLWTNPYYDLAKLSHSICGKYDFFNNGLHHISLTNDLKFKLDIDFDNIAYKSLFETYVTNSGYSYIAIRIYELSLFLSMLPLHMDNPQKVFGFILNAIDIIKEVENCLEV